MAYDITPVKAPRATGTLLRLLCSLAESRLTGPLLAPQLLAQVGVSDLRLANVEHAQWGPAELWRLAQQQSDKQAADVPHTDWPEGAFRYNTAADYAVAYRKGAANPEDVAWKFVESWADSDKAKPALRAFIAVDPEDVMAQAKESRARFEAGKPLGPLDGVPVAVKDELDQVGFPTTVGTRFLGTDNALHDAHVVRKLRAAGAVLIGKANMHEFGMGVTGLNPHHGSARNPHNPAHATGGSSSGSACAVAAGLCPIAVGADGGGSIRIPSSFCGVVGLKPTFGRVSENGAAPVCWSVAHIGPIGASVADVALGYSLMAGPDPQDDNTHGHPLATLGALASNDLTGVKLGIYSDWFDDADKPVATACRAVLSRLEEAGAKLVEIEIPELGLLRTVHLVTIVSEMATAHELYYRAHRKDYGLDVRMNLALARRLTARDYVHAQRLRTRINRHFFEQLHNVDAIVTPATGITAPPLPEDALKTGESNLTLATRIMLYAMAANLTGLPAISFPAGYDDSGLPIGLQAMGGPFAEDRLLQLAQIAESHVGRQKPAVHFDLLT
jgi:Asp-tRNA(Asn)/Glu-tRNA(Gln) amidotransferase A subunit family amidase